MKKPLQLTPARSAATVCTLLWFAIWMLGFRPAPMGPERSVSRPNAALRPADARNIPDYLDPSLFALPASKGFSGSFPPARINLALQFDAPRQATVELPPGRIREGDPDPSPLFEPVALSESGEQAPAVTALRPLAGGSGIEFFFSPELAERMPAPPQVELDGELPASVRIRLSVGSDGSVDQVFFETPVQNGALLAAIRNLRFTPAPQQTAGTLELRVNGGGS